MRSAVGAASVISEAEHLENYQNTVIVGFSDVELGWKIDFKIFFEAMQL